MTRRIGIIISLVLALVFTTVIVTTANRDYNRATETVKVARTKAYIPVGQKIRAADLEEVEIVKSAASNLVTVGEAEGRTALVSLVEGQYITKNSLGNEPAPLAGYVEVVIPLDLATSANVRPGERVNIHVTDPEYNQEQQQENSASNFKEAPLVLQNIRVLSVLDSRGKEITPDSGGLVEAAAAAANSRQIAAVGLEIPEEHAGIIVLAASKQNIYLTRISADAAR